MTDDPSKLPCESKLLEDVANLSGFGLSMMMLSLCRRNVFWNAQRYKQLSQRIPSYEATNSSYVLRVMTALRINDRDKL